jgi:hypothetical protein
MIKLTKRYCCVSRHCYLAVHTGTNGHLYLSNLFNNNNNKNLVFTTQKQCIFIAKTNPLSLFKEIIYVLYDNQTDAVCARSTKVLLLRQVILKERLVITRSLQYWGLGTNFLRK